MDNQTLDGDQLRARREALELTQDDLARLFGVALNTVSRWELGNMAIRGQGAIELALQRLESLGVKKVKNLINNA